MFPWEVCVNTVEDVVDAALEVLNARPSALVTDVDGTLSPIVANPQDAEVSIAIKEALRVLRPRLDLLAVVTGREGPVARRMVGVEGLTYVGSYALGVAELPAIVTDDIRRVREAVTPYLPRLAGVTLELKEISFALHYRNCEDPVGARARILSILEPIASGSHARLMEGKQVIEIVPRQLPDKGVAFAELVERHQIDGAVFVGDDLADSAIFRRIAQRRQAGHPGLAVGVVDSETPAAVREAADLLLPGVDSVEAFVVLLAQRVAALREPIPGSSEA